MEGTCIVARSIIVAIPNGHSTTSEPLMATIDSCWPIIIFVFCLKILD